MKTIRYISVIMMFFLLITSCQREEIWTEPSSYETFDLHIKIPYMKRMYTRAAMEEGVIDNMHVLVFDQNGGFISRSQAIQLDNNPGTYRVLLPKTDPDLPLENKKRIIHCIANLDWTGFSDVTNQGKSENEVIMKLSTSDKKNAYWRRIVLHDGIKDNAFTSSIELICNVARISVLDNTTSDPSSGFVDITDVTFAIGDYLDHGTVAPFDKSSFQFGEDKVVESPDGVRQTIKDSDFIHRAGTGVLVDGTIECYEHVNSISDHPMYVIIKCIYPGDTDHSYYKIDIMAEQELLNIQRNCHYIIDMKEVTGRGYLTLQEAILSPAANNLIYSVLLEKYTSISYGKAALYVETTDRTFIQSNQDYRIGYSYFPDIGEEEDNSSVVLSLENEDNSRPVVSTWQLIKTTGSAHIQCKTAAELPEYGRNNAKFIISSNESGVLLRRVINISLVKPVNFIDPYISEYPIPNTAGQEVNLHFTIPSDLSESYYPIEVFISTTILSPNLDTDYNSGLTLDHKIKDRYRYKYIVRNPGEHIVYFKTILNATPKGELLLESELFTPIILPLG